jgi:hypothetical protein
MDPVLVAFQVANQPFPADTVAAGFLLVLHPDPAADGSQPDDVTQLIPLDAVSQDPTPGAPAGLLVYTLPNVPIGTYAGSIALVDGSGLALAPAVSAVDKLVVAASGPVTVSLPVPTTLTLTPQ